MVPVTQFAPIAPAVPVQDVQFDELKVAMDAQVTLITTPIAHKKDKEPSEATKHFRPLADEVYTKVLHESTSALPSRSLMETATLQFTSQSLQQSLQMRCQSCNNF